MHKIIWRMNPTFSAEMNMRAIEWEIECDTFVVREHDVTIYQAWVTMRQWNLDGRLSRSLFVASPLVLPDDGRSTIIIDGVEIKYES